MQVERILRPSQVLTVWEFFLEGFETLRYLARQHFDVVAMQKYCCLLASDHTGGYLGIAFTDEGDPQAMLVAREVTLPYSKERIFEVIALYNRRSQEDTLLLLMGAFENWCRENGVVRYYFTTHRNTGATIRYYRHERFGFRKPALVFEKDIL